jgi:transglutaminase-like putative cysteine protease
MLTAKISAAVLLLTAPFVPQPKTRQFHFEYAAAPKSIPAGAKHLDFWLPIPHSDDFQQISNLHIDSPVPYALGAVATGNTILHVGLDQPAAAFSVRVSFDCLRKEHVQAQLAGGPPLVHDEDHAALAQYLKPDRLVPIDDQIRAWATDVVTKAGAHTDLEKARAIYDHVVATVKYDKTGKGWGRGDIYYACEERRGNCTDFHAIVIGYACALGIPARFAIGFPLPVDRGEGEIAGYHCWAEVYVKHIGWIPIDASEAANNPARRDYFFGAHDENRIEFSKGRDIILTPRQQGEPLNYFVYPYAEVDGQHFTEVTSEVSYRDSNERNRTY